MRDDLKIFVCEDGAALVEQESGEWVRESMPAAYDPRSPYREYREMFARDDQEDGDF